MTSASHFTLARLILSQLLRLPLESQLLFESIRILQPRRLVSHQTPYAAGINKGRLWPRHLPLVSTFMMFLPYSRN
ncbi:hypothetical protein BC936DRAFT_142296 [Jimgerdemannia flammicorona]|uniref:Uncharacterized protein n=1 Tax=Jimgerdemannia flammicorona TaxID=994334 RepID=A0A433DFB4_9FUNG|nr:hypothetical protein BC936DRAFT_142296 [Jimgerdemannia flammicorona]